MGTVTVRFYAELNDLVSAGGSGRELERQVGPGETVKDLVEALGVPHTEVDLVLVNGEPAPLGHRLQDRDRISVYPVFESLDITAVSSVRARPLRQTRFVADEHLGTLARYLRVLGFDTDYRSHWEDADLVEVALREKRIILTRDRGLLKRAVVDHGYLVRETRPRAQLVEVVRRFDLAGNVRPFSRCPRCNGEVAAVAKSEVLAVLPPRTAGQVDEFNRCLVCGQVYWQGAHHRGLAGLVELATGVGAEDRRQREKGSV